MTWAANSDLHGFWGRQMAAACPRKAEKSESAATGDCGQTWRRVEERARFLAQWLFVCVPDGPSQPSRTRPACRSGCPPHWVARADTHLRMQRK